MRLFMKKVYMGVLFSLLLAAWALPMGAGAEEYACTASIPVRVQVYAQTDTAFTVQLEAPEGTPLPESRTLTFTGSGEGAFGPVEYTVPGDYVYTLHQTKGNAAYVTYDETVYTVTVRVTPLMGDDVDQENNSAQLALRLSDVSVEEISSTVIGDGAVETVVRVDRRMTYTAVNAILTDGGIEPDGSGGSCPEAEDVAERVLCLPLWPDMEEDLIREIGATVSSVMAGA